AGQEQLADRLAAQLHEGAAALPGVRAFDLITGGSCAPDEATCLGAVARRADLDAILTAEVAATASGYRWRLREVSAGGELLHEARGETRGGPLDLAGDLERAVCEAAGAGRCDGEIRVVGDTAAAIFVDGVDRGPPPISVRLPVGRHLVRAGGDERRVQVSYARTARLSFTALADGAALPESGGPMRVPALAVSAAPEAEPRSRAARALFGG